MINDTWLRLGIFLTVLVTMMLWEGFFPNRRAYVRQSIRWFSNFSLVILGSMVSKILLPSGLAAVAIFAQHHQLGWWNNVAAPYWLVVLLTVILLDGIIYWQHRLFHRIPMLWQIHKVHHGDPHLDASTGLRFHPLEFALSLLVKCGAIIVLGAPIMAIVIFEVLLNGASIFTHSNITLPKKIDHLLRTFIVTQAMHRIHHSQLPNEMHSNFGFNLSIWDRCFGSYTKDANQGDARIKLGLQEYTSPQSNSHLVSLLLMALSEKAALTRLSIILRIYLKGIVSKFYQRQVSIQLGLQSHTNCRALLVDN